MDQKIAIFAAGCFWGVEEHFRRMPGVLKTQVGYTGGHTTNPTYQEVCRGNTGHAEAIEILFDPNKITYEALVREFFAMHDPTTKDRQGPDIGSQYRSAIFYTDDEQKKIGADIIRSLDTEKAFNSPIVTEVTAANEFFPAEAYHQCYLMKRQG